MSSSPDLFVHVPKTAGTSLRAVLLNAYEPHTVWNYSQIVEGYINAGDEVLTENNLRRQRVKQLILSALPKRLVESRVQAAKRQLDPIDHVANNAKAVIGHLPINDFRLQFAPLSPRIFTVVRDPLSRMVSHHAYAQARLQLPTELRGWISTGDAAMPFGEYALSEPLQNFQTSFTGSDPLQYEYIGTTETFTNFLAQVGLMGANSQVPHLRVQNARTAEPLLQDPGFKREFEAFHAIDYEFYEYAADLARQRNLDSAR